MNVLYDAFTGTGGTWVGPWTKTQITGTATDVNFGTIGVATKNTGAAGALVVWTTTADTSIGDGEVFTYCFNAPAGTWQHVLTGRFNGTSTMYFVTCEALGIIGKLGIYKNVSGTITALGTLTSSVTVLPFFVKFQCIGTTIRAKIWSSTEQDWSGSDVLSITDSSITAAGRWGIGGFDPSSATTGQTVSFDDCYIDNFVPASRPKPQVDPLLLR